MTIIRTGLVTSENTRISSSARRDETRLPPPAGKRPHVGVAMRHSSISACRATLTQAVGAFLSESISGRCPYSARQVVGIPPTLMFGQAHGSARSRHEPRRRAQGRTRTGAASDSLPYDEVDERCYRNRAANAGGSRYRHSRTVLGVSTRGHRTELLSADFNQEAGRHLLEGAASASGTTVGVRVT